MTPELAKQICINAHKGQWRRPNIFRIPEDGTIEGINKHIAHRLATANFIIYRENKYSYNEKDILQKQEHYHTHPIAVADMMTTDEEKIIAYLHDITENCSGWYLSKEPDYSKFYLVSKNKESIPLTYRIYWALHLLSHPKNMSYTDYIKQLISANMISGLRNTEINRLATKVKIADLTCNLLDNPSQRQKSKYSTAMQQLLKSL